MKWRDVLGHTDQVEMFRRSIHRGRLSHSYLFAGPAGIGKKLFARVLAQCLLCEEFADAALQSCDQCPGCKQVAAQTHPDFFNVGRLEGKTELTIDVFLGPKERRGKEGLCYDLSLKPMAADRRIAIIDDADFMNEESANALLKTLEEPPPQSLLILIASNIDAILPTIRSRCQFVRFSPLKLVDISQLIIEQELVQDNDEAERIAAISEGSLTMAEQLLTFAFFITLFAGSIAIGVVYNSARIAVSERSHELASLRVLGFTRGEISYILLGELALLTLAGIGMGFLLGRGLGIYIITSLQTDLFRIPLVIAPSTYAFAAAVVLAASAISALMVRRKLDHLDLVAVLKTKE